MNEITNTQDIIDSRDVIERIDEIENSFPDTCEHCGEGLDSLDDFIEFKFDFVCQDCKQPLDFDQDDVDELKALKDLAEQCEGHSPYWKYDGALIHDDYFEEYAQELAEDIGAIGSNAPWPTHHIDWEAAADALKMDYIRIQFGDNDYWMRA